MPLGAKEKKNEEKEGGEVKKFVDAVDIDMGKLFSKWYSNLSLAWNLFITVQMDISMIVTPLCHHDIMTLRGSYFYARLEPSFSRPLCHVHMG